MKIKYIYKSVFSTRWILASASIMTNERLKLLRVCAPVVTNNFHWSVVWYFVLIIEEIVEANIFSIILYIYSFIKVHHVLKNKKKWRNPFKNIKLLNRYYIEKNVYENDEENCCFYLSYRQYTSDINWKIKLKKICFHFILNYRMSHPYRHFFWAQNIHLFHYLFFKENLNWKFSEKTSI